MLVIVVPSPLPAASSVDVEPFVADNRINDIKISPDGRYLALSVPFDDQTGLRIIDREQGVVTAQVGFRNNTHVHNFWWAAPDRVIISLAESYGSRDQPLLTGELWGLDADGKKSGILIGWRKEDGPQIGSRIGSSRRDGNVAAFLVDLLPSDDANILVAIQPFTRDPHVTVERLNIYNGKRSRVAQLPVPYADFVTDSKGQVRFGVGSGADNFSQLFYRENDRAEWRQLNHQRESRRVEVPLGFSHDDRTAYLRVSQASGPDKLFAMDTASGERREIVVESKVDPRPIYRDGWGAIIGARYLHGAPNSVYFDADDASSRLLKSLESAFEGNEVYVQSSTLDGRYKVVQVQSDVDPGSFYLFDTVAKKAEFLFARGEKLDARKMVPAKPISFKARDGLELHGFLTAPAGSAGRNLPLVIMPHGGPFDVFDTWAFDVDSQLLAQAGYAVIRVNFRGSGNYGLPFRQAGAREWGGKMQDDLTDATHWAIREGIADPGRVCIYGASYGGYAALMGVAKEPDLYRCAVGYVGVYDLNRLVKAKRMDLRALRNWREDWIGSDSTALAAASPNRLASRIKVPVFLAAGGEDLQAPVEHTELMEKALKAAGVPVETLYYPKEGHGFYKPEHRREFYTRLIAFLDRHIGKPATAVGAAAGD